MASSSLKDDIVKFVVDIQSSGNQKKLIDDLKNIETQSAALRKEQDDLRKAMAFLETTGRKNDDIYKKLASTYKENEQQLKKNAAASKSLQSGLDKTYMSSNQLLSRSKELQKALNGMSKAANPQEYDRLEKELNGVNDELRKLQVGAKQTSNSFTSSQFSLQGLKDSAKGLLPAFGIAAIITGITAAGRSIFNLKTHMDGEGRRAAIVFGDSLKYVEAQATNLAQKMGLTNREFVAAAAGTADLLVPLGFTRQQSAEMAVQMTNLSGALDEWTAGKYGAVEISSRLTRAVLGECDSLKELGIGIRLDSKEYKDLVKQKKDAGAATDAQAQALAIMSMIMQKSIDAQTSYAGSGNELLRTQKKMESGWRSLKEKIVDYFSLSADERLLKEAESIKAQSNAIDKNNKYIEDLLVKYEKLSSKTNRSKIEQEDLNRVIQDLGKFAPGAITQVDAYGNAMSISAGKIREAMEAQRLLNKEKQKGAIQELNNSVTRTSAIGMLNGDKAFANQAKSNIREGLAKQEYFSNQKKTGGHTPGINASNDEMIAGGVRMVTSGQAQLQKANENMAKKALMLNEMGQTIAESAKLWGMSEYYLQSLINNLLKGSSKNNDTPTIPTVDDKKKTSYSLNKDPKFQAEEIKLKKDYFNGLIKTEEEYNKKSLELEISTLSAKLKNGKLSKDERLQIELQLFDKRISLMKELKKEEDKANDEQKKQDDKHAEGIKKLNELTQKYGIKNTEDKIAQLNAQKQADIAALDQSLKGTDEYERAKKAIEDYYYTLKKEESLKRRAQDQIDKANATVLNAETLEQEYQAKITLENIQFEQEKQRLIEQHLSTEALEAEHKKRLLAIETSYTQQKIQVASMLMSSTNNIFGAMASFYESQKQRELRAAGNDEKKKEEINRRYARKQQQIAVGQALIAGAMAIMQIWAGTITGNPLVDAIIKGVLTAGQVITTGIQVATIKKQQFREGGYTARSSSDDEAVGVVHANEFVATADAKRNPTVKPILDVLDKAQRNKTIRTLDLRQVLGSNGFKDGGYTRTTEPTIINNSDALLKETIETNKQLRDVLSKPIKSIVSMLGPDGIVENQNKYNDWKENTSL